MKKVIAGIIVLVLAIGILLVAKSNKDNSVATPSAATSGITSSTPEASTSPQQDQNTITLTSDFSPKTLTIKAGKNVVWKNESSADAAVNSSPHPAHTDYPPLNLGAFSSGETLSLTFSEKGTYKYHDHLNPGRFGTIIVQ